MPPLRVPPASLRRLMQSARERNSAVERAAATQEDPLVAANASATQRAQRVPQPPEQCVVCQRWVDKDRLAVTPIGAPACCSICAAFDQVWETVKDSQLSLENEDEVLELLFQVHILLRRR